MVYFRCDFNKFTMKIIKEMSLKKISEIENADDDDDESDDEEMLITRSAQMSDSDTSEE